MHTLKVAGKGPCKFALEINPCWFIFSTTWFFLLNFDLLHLNIVFGQVSTSNVNTCWYMARVQNSTLLKLLNLQSYLQQLSTNSEICAICYTLQVWVFNNNERNNFCWLSTRGLPAASPLFPLNTYAWSFSSFQEQNTNTRP